MVATTFLGAKPTLSYFNLDGMGWGGRGGAVRFFFLANGVEFKEDRIAMSDWASIKQASANAAPGRAGCRRDPGSTLCSTHCTACGSAHIFLGGEVSTVCRTWGSGACNMRMQRADRLPPPPPRTPRALRASLACEYQQAHVCHCLHWRVCVGGGGWGERAERAVWVAGRGLPGASPLGAVMLQARDSKALTMPLGEG